VNNTTGDSNSFFGEIAGWRNNAGSRNSFFGRSAGGENTDGAGNTFIGAFAGGVNASGNNNTFVGDGASFDNRNPTNPASPTGSNDTLLGKSAQVISGLSNATAIGANAQVTQSNTLVLGSINGINGATADAKVGIGTTAPKAKLDVAGGNILVGSPGQGIILKSPNGATCKLFSIDNAGAMVLTAVACP
jgi:hypothetical protein